MVFHIHINASKISDSLYSFFCEELGFNDRPFDIVHEFSSKYAPRFHLTKHIRSSIEFKEIFKQLEHKLRYARDMIGYIEGEYIALDKAIPYLPFRGYMHAPITLELCNTKGVFRKSEVHLSMDIEKSDMCLLKELHRIGLFSCILQKKDYLSQIFTAQGRRKDIEVLITVLEKYLLQVGGAANCTLKEERTARYFVSGDDVVLPPQIHSIHL